MSWQVETDSPLGIILLTATEKGLAGVDFADQIDVDRLDQVEDIPERVKEILFAAAEQLDEYFHSQRQEFDLQLDLNDQLTEYQEKVIQALKRIDYGHKVTYQQLAEEVGGSPRSVGNALGTNPLLIVYPCHRVLPSNGTLGGFKAGPEIKSALLELESS